LAHRFSLETLGRHDTANGRDGEMVPPVSGRTSRRPFPRTRDRRRSCRR
jgi:hypothetical protein